ncbi:hypothetical protein [Siccirubricoccus sp. G192]|uniref:hypothetical protein n=1 Tax=Siccirubricoccus sp. G192 TaxID=2849651 RepID=UPI001C2BFBD6|nr:hypothetical protein [Siccirubricoccus sp. G192]MBV1797143.1 hypothetical protein [Siccirubricoccus sp. G192]
MLEAAGLEALAALPEGRRLVNPAFARIGRLIAPQLRRTGPTASQPVPTRYAGSAVSAQV